MTDMPTTQPAPPTPKPTATKPARTARVTLPCPVCGGAGNVHTSQSEKGMVVSACDNCAGAGSISFTVTPE